MRILLFLQLKQLAHELRWETINAVSKVGGHLGSSLGVVELTVALHYVFDAPVDKIIWDVAHQSYPHKILTGNILCPCLFFFSRFLHSLSKCLNIILIVHICS